MSKIPNKTEKLELLRRVAIQRASRLLPSVFTYLGALLANEDAPHGARLQATAIILDRALGKAKEIKEIAVVIDANTQHLDALKAINQAFLDASADERKMIDITPSSASEGGDDDAS